MSGKMKDEKNTPASGACDDPGTPHTLSKKIKQITFECGIQEVGFCAFEEVAEKLLDCRAKSRIPENAQTVIVFLFPYKVKAERPQNISRYAAVPDYHKIAGGYLEKIKQQLKKEFPANSFEPFIDNSPIPETTAAALAGLGVLGENRLLINEKWGSWCFIGEIVTDLKIPSGKHIKNCPLCGDCKKACPIGVRDGICLSAVSQQKNDLSEHQKTLLRKNKIIWGCDLCAESCFLNKDTPTTYIPEFITGYKNSYTPGENITARAYEWRGEKIVKRNFDNLRGE